MVEANPSSELTLFWEVYNNVTAVMIMLLQIYAGAILVKSVLQIKRYFNANNLEDKMNTANMIVHAGSFLFYLVGTAAMYICQGIYLIKQTPLTDSLWTLSSLFYFLASFIS